MKCTLSGLKLEPSKEGSYLVEKFRMFKKRNTLKKVFTFIFSENTLLSCMHKQRAMKRRRGSSSIQEDEFEKTLQDLRRMTDNLDAITKCLRTHKQELADRDAEIKQLTDQLEKTRNQVIESLPSKGTTRIICAHCPIFIDVCINKWNGEDSRFKYKWVFDMDWRCGACS